MSEQSSTQTTKEHRDFLARLRHELRTPLNPIIGYSEMLIEDLQDEGPVDLLRNLQGINKTGKKLLDQINEFLDPARVGAGDLDVDLQTLHVALLMNLEEQLDQINRQSKSALQTAEEMDLHDLTPDLQKIAAAVQRFAALIDELAGQEEALPPGDWQSKEQAVAMADDAAATLREFERKEQDRAVYKGKILVVDDNEVNRDVLSRHLMRQGHEVSQAENGRHALNMLQDQPFDLVLLDILMPQLDGYQVLQQLKNDPQWRDIPVIMISALDELQSIVRCIKLGAEDYLSKPFDPVLLQARIGASLEKKRFRDQEVQYLRNVSMVTAAAAAVENEDFLPDQLALGEVAGRDDELGLLARVFQKMAREVHKREQNLKRKVQALTIELDQAKQAKKVEEIVESDFFKQLESEADELRGLMDEI